MTFIADNFLSNCGGLTAFDSARLGNVTSIGNGFLKGCAGLTTFDTAGLSNVTSIGNHFLVGCHSLTPEARANNSRFSESIRADSATRGSLLWENCHTREFTAALNKQPCHITLSDAQLNEKSRSMLQALFAAARHEHTLILNVGDNSDIVDQQGVLQLTMHQLPAAIKHLRLVNSRGNVTSIQSDFLQYCSDLTTFDAAGLGQVTSIGDNFLLNCTRLTTFNRAALVGVSIGRNPFLGCTGLTTG